MQPTDACERLLSNEVAEGEQRDGGIFTPLRYDSEFYATGLKVIDGVGGASLREEGLLWLELDDPSPQAGICQKFRGVKRSFMELSHLVVPSL
jgi:hypothetical protein